MKNSNVTLIIIFGLLIILLGFIFLKKDNNKQITREKIRIAACPTFHYLKKDLEKLGVKFIAAESTAESLALLSDYDVDIVLAGRTLKPDEPNFNFTALGNSCCSFISRAAARGEEEDLSSSPGQAEQILLEEDFDNFVFYTNLDPGEVKGFFPDIKNIEKVENVYEFLDNRAVGIIL